MIDEKLTEDERAVLRGLPADSTAGAASRKALRCLDAALARADAAEQNMKSSARAWQEQVRYVEAEAAALRAESEGRRAVLVQKAEELATEWRRAEAAEARLAAAEALLREAADGHDEDPDGNIGCGLTERIRAFLSKQ